MGEFPGTHEKKEEREGGERRRKGEGRRRRCRPAVAPVAAVARRWYPSDPRIVGKTKVRINFFFSNAKCVIWIEIGRTIL